jgi:hypothetical protein
MSTEKNYTFWITTPDGQEIQWRGLTQKQAESMNKLTEDAVVWSGVRGFGWSEMNKKSIWSER